MTQDELQLAAELQAGRPGPDEWGDAELEGAPAARRTRLGAMVSVRLSEAELAELQKRAKSYGESVSGLVRRLVLQDIESQRGSEQRADRLVAVSTAGSFYVSTASIFVAVEGASSFKVDSAEGTSFASA